MPSDSDLELTSIRTEDLNLEDKDLTVEHVPVQVDAPEDVSESCLICVSRPRAVRFLPCRHATMCELCTIAEMQRTGQCPNCRRKVLQLVAVFAGGGLGLGADRHTGAAKENDNPGHA